MTRYFQTRQPLLVQPGTCTSYIKKIFPYAGLAWMFKGMGSVLSNFAGPEGLEASCVRGFDNAKNNLESSYSSLVTGAQFLGGSLLTGMFVPMGVIGASALTYKGGEAWGSVEGLSEKMKAGACYLVTGYMIFMATTCFDILVAGLLLEKSLLNMKYEEGYTSYRQNSTCYAPHVPEVIVGTQVAFTLAETAAILVSTWAGMFKGRKLLAEKGKRQDYSQTIDSELDNDALESKRNTR